MKNKEKKSVGFPVAHTISIQDWMKELARQVNSEGNSRLSLCELKEKIKYFVKPNASVQPEEAEQVHHKIFVEVLG